MILKVTEMNFKQIFFTFNTKNTLNSQYFCSIFLKKASPNLHPECAPGQNVLFTNNYKHKLNRNAVLLTHQPK